MRQHLFIALSFAALGCGGQIAKSEQMSESAPNEPFRSAAEDRPMHHADDAAPNLIAESEISPTSIVSDETRVFWTTKGSTLLGEPTINGTLMMRYKQGGEKLMLALDARGAAYRTLVRTGDTLVWSTSDGRILSLGRSGGTPKELVFVGAEVRALSIDSDQVYFASERGDIGTVSLADGRASILTTGLVSPRALTSDDLFVYVTVGRSADADVLRIPKAGGEGAVLFSGLTSPCGLAVTQGEAFVVDLGANAVVSVSLRDGKALSLGRSVAACSLGIDSNFLYWMKRQELGDLVVRTDRLSGQEQVLANGAADAPIYVDSADLYWATETAVYSRSK